MNDFQKAMSDADPIANHPKTMLETFDDRFMGQPRIPTMKETVDDTMAYRPVVRPPVAVLTILDDGRNDGESFRLRNETFTIGRTEGDCTLPHDNMISRKHVSITRKTEKGRVRWLLEDLGSHNGTFVRVADAVLTHGQQILIGGKRYIFNAAPRASTVSAPGQQGEDKTQGWQAVSPQDLIPSLTEIRPDGSKGEPMFLTDSEVVIGRDSTCQIVLDDLMVSPHHAKLYKDERDNWIVENLNALNGTWVRVEQLTFERSGQFLIGEQRFVLKL